MIYRLAADISLQPLRNDMHKSLFELTDHNRRYLRRWLPWLDQVQTASDSLAYIQRTIDQQLTDDSPTFAIYHATTLIGIAGFHPQGQQQKSRALGYWLSQEYAGRGIVTAAATVLLNIGFKDMKLNCIELHCHVENVASRRIAEKLGFQLTELRTRAEWLYDHWVDHAHYRLLANKYEIEAQP